MSKRMMNGDERTRFSISKKGDKYAVINGGGTHLDKVIGLDRVKIELKIENGQHILYFKPYRGEGSYAISKDTKGGGWHVNVPVDLAKTLRGYEKFNYKQLVKRDIKSDFGDFTEVYVDLDDRPEKEETVSCNANQMPTDTTEKLLHIESMLEKLCQAWGVL